MAATASATNNADSWSAQSAEIIVAMSCAKKATGNAGNTNLFGSRCSLRSITVNGHATTSKYRAGIRAISSDRLGTSPR